MQNQGSNISTGKQQQVASKDGGNVDTLNSSEAQAGIMKAPGQNSYISRSEFEANPAAYFNDLSHHDIFEVMENSGSNNSNGQQQQQAASKDGGASDSLKASGAQAGDMKAPGQNGYISRNAFEANPAAYFNDLHKK